MLSSRCGFLVLMLPDEGEAEPAAEVQDEIEAEYWSLVSCLRSHCRDKRSPPTPASVWSHRFEFVQQTEHLQEKLTWKSNNFHVLKSDSKIWEVRTYYKKKTKCKPWRTVWLGWSGASDEFNGFHFPDLLIQRMEEVPVPINNTPLRALHLDPVQVLSHGQQMAHTHTCAHTRTGDRKRSGHGNGPVMVCLVCHWITWPNLLSSTTIYLI